MAEIRWINKNKCCIEIYFPAYNRIVPSLINKNKCCIEIVSLLNLLNYSY